MTHAEAMQEARRRWGTAAQIQRTFHQQPDVFMVGRSSRIWGRGRTWEEAFQKATDRVTAALDQIQMQGRTRKHLVARTA